MWEPMDRGYLRRP
ncbi:hypothetical protein Taro_043278 [Colocasia esculenta]|uniref:Uncharacterized protein n=1 Tax=Colocasia esculenta TaxID=4460 RepID=A0A843X0C3_COLES|nr:hypothetical protein [Colocasia esculenta]